MGTEKFCPSCHEALVFRPKERPQRFRNRKFCSRKCAIEHRKVPEKHISCYRGSRKLTNRICAREGCKRRVPEGNRMLCLECQRYGERLAEAIGSFDEKEKARWERGEQVLLKRLKQQVRLFSARHMTQEELRALVPSLQEHRV